MRDQKSGTKRQRQEESVTSNVEEAWDPKNNTILVITKAKDNRLVNFTRQLAEWLIFTPRFGKENPFIVYVDGHLHDSKVFGYKELVQKNAVWKDNCKFWTPKLCYKQPELFHLIITLGGDGTILFTSTLFQTKVPPIMPFNLGSLGFLTPFLFTKYICQLDKLFKGELQSTTRMRLSCTIYRYRKAPYCLMQPKKGDTVLINSVPVADPSTAQDHSKWELMETAWMRKAYEKAATDSSNDDATYSNDNVMCYKTIPEQTVHVLNELVVDRGPNSNISMLELFADERHLTTVQADGLCIATATGSTAYSLSASGSLTHPDMHCTLVTPICPHTLNFRPMILPSQIAIRIVVPFGSRNTAFCSFDGRSKLELKHGDHVKVAESPYPVKTYCACSSSNDWFSSVQKCLQWNMRKRQKSFVVVEGGSDNNSHIKHEPKSDSLFACIRPNQDGPSQQEPEQVGDKVEKEEEQEQDNVASGSDSFDLIPWTDEELERD